MDAFQTPHAAPAMPAPASPAASPLGAQDADHLRLLATFHYVVAGLLALFSLFPVIHLVIGVAMVSGTMPMQSSGNNDINPQLFGWFFVVFAALFIIAGLTLAGFLAYAGRCLAQRRRHTLCLVVAAIACVFTPFGTVLGVFTLVVLMRPQVKQAFAAATPA